jgi:hypothetical protein
VDLSADTDVSETYIYTFAHVTTPDVTQLQSTFEHWADIDFVQKGLNKTRKYVSQVTGPCAEIRI